MSNILLVEDDPLGVVSTKFFLETCGHEVHAVFSVREAVALVQDQSFDLVITDLGLPDATGEEFLQRLGARGIKTPVVAFSGRRPRATHPFAAYLPKPCAPKALLDVVDRLAQS